MYQSVPKYKQRFNRIVVCKRSLHLGAGKYLFPTGITGDLSPQLERSPNPNPKADPKANPKAKPEAVY